MANQDDPTSRFKEIKRIIESKNHNLDNLDNVEMIINTIYNTLGRYSDTKDPIIRYSLFLDKFMIMFDIFAAAVTSKVGPFGNELSPGELEGMDLETSSQQYSQLLTRIESVKQKMDMIVTRTRLELIKLADYIQKDMYSPDHPPGAKLLDEAKKDYDGRK